MIKRFLSYVILFIFLFSSSVLAEQHTVRITVTDTLSGSKNGTELNRTIYTEEWDY